MKMDKEDEMKMESGSDEQQSPIPIHFQIDSLMYETRTEKTNAINNKKVIFLTIYC